MNRIYDLVVAHDKANLSKLYKIILANYCAFASYIFLKNI